MLLFVSVSDRMFYLKTAKKTREVLWDSTVRRILDNMKPLLKEGKVLGPNQSKWKKVWKTHRKDCQGCYGSQGCEPFFEDNGMLRLVMQS